MLIQPCVCVCVCVYVRSAVRIRKRDWTKEGIGIEIKWRKEEGTSIVIYIVYEARVELIWIGRVPLTRRSFVNIVDDMIRFSEVRVDISQTIDTMETKTKLCLYTLNILPI